MTQQNRLLIITLTVVVLFLTVSYLVVRSKKILAENIDQGSKASPILADGEKVKSKNLSDLKSKVLTINDLDVVIGAEDAAITIIEYASYSCSHCAKFAESVYPRLKEKYIDTGKVKFILRDYPLDEPSLRASQLSRCAAKEDYESLSKVLFSTRADWAYHKNFPEKLENIAKILGISGEEFHECMSNKQLEEAIMTNRLDVSKAFNISSTPTLIINGKKFQGKTIFSEISEYVDKLIK